MTSPINPTTPFNGSHDPLENFVQHMESFFRGQTKTWDGFQTAMSSLPRPSEIHPRLQLAERFFLLQALQQNLLPESNINLLVKKTDGTMTKATFKVAHAEERRLVLVPQEGVKAPALYIHQHKPGVSASETMENNIIRELLKDSEHGFDFISDSFLPDEICDEEYLVKVRDGHVFNPKEASEAEKQRLSNAIAALQKQEGVDTSSIHLTFHKNVSGVLSFLEVLEAGELDFDDFILRFPPTDSKAETKAPSTSYQIKYQNQSASLKKNDVELFDVQDRILAEAFFALLDFKNDSTEEQQLKIARSKIEIAKLLREELETRQDLIKIDIEYDRNLNTFLYQEPGQ